MEWSWGDWRREKERESLFSNTVFGSFWYRCELCVVPALITRQPRTFCCADDDDSLLYLYSIIIHSRQATVLHKHHKRHHLTGQISPLQSSWWLWWLVTGYGQGKSGIIEKLLLIIILENNNNTDDQIESHLYWHVQYFLLTPIIRLSYWSINEAISMSKQIHVTTDGIEVKMLHRGDAK